MAADYNIVVAQFSSPTATGSQSYTTTDLGGVTPKAAMVVLSYASADGVPSDTVVAAVGFTDATRQACSSYFSQDGLASSNSGVRNNNAEVIRTHAAEELRAIRTSMDTNGFTLNWSAVDTVAHIFTVVFFAGPDIDVYVDSLDAGTAPTDVTAPGFEPDIVICSSNFTSMSSGDSGFGLLSVGISQNDGADLQRSINVTSTDNQSTTKVASLLSTTRIVDAIYNDAKNYDILISDFDASGFSVTANSNSRGFAYIALKGNNGLEFKAGSIDSPTSIGDWAVTGIGFQPSALLLGLTGATAENTIQTNSNGGSWGIASADDNGNEWCRSWRDQDNVTTTVAKSQATSQILDFPKDDGTDMHVGTLSSFDSDGWTINLTVADGTTRKWIYLAAGESGAPPTGGKYRPLLLHGVG